MGHFMPEFSKVHIKRKKLVQFHRLMQQHSTEYNEKHLRQKSQNLRGRPPQFIGIVRRVIYIYTYIRTSLHTYDIVYVDYLHIY
jgi:hypothetical protein